LNYKHTVSIKIIPVSTLRRWVQYPSRASQCLPYKGEFSIHPEHPSVYLTMV